MFLAPTRWMFKGYNAKNESGVLGIEIRCKRPKGRSIHIGSGGDGMESMRTLGVRDF
jgi:hypothetical protein